MLGPGQGNYTLLHGELEAFRCQGGGTGPDIWSPLCHSQHQVGPSAAAVGWNTPVVPGIAGKGARFRRTPSFSLSGRRFFLYWEKNKKPILPQAPSFPVHRRQDLGPFLSIGDTLECKPGPLCPCFTKMAVALLAQNMLASTRG